jgi:hypothetical protein
VKMSVTSKIQAFQKTTSDSLSKLKRRAIAKPSPVTSMAHRLISGMTGSGKTNYMLVELVREAIAGQCAIIAVFPHRKAGIDFIATLYGFLGEYLFQRLLIEDLQDINSVVMRSFIQKSHLQGLERNKENELYLSAVQEMIFRRRTDIKDLAEHPVLEKYTRIAIRAFQELDTWIPEWMIPFVLQPKHPHFGYIRAHVQDEEIQYELEQMASMAPREQFQLLEPGARVLTSMYGNATIKARTSRIQTFDKRAFLNHGGILVVLGGDVSDDAIRTFTASDFQETYRLVKSGLDRPVIWACDEVNNYYLIGNAESKAMATVRGLGKGMELWIATQALNFPNDDITSNVLTNTDHFWFLNGDPKTVELAARDLAGSFDEQKVHHKRSVQRHAGFKEVKRIGKSTSRREDGKDGYLSAEGETESIQLVPQYVMEDEDVYQSGAEQLVWQNVEIQRLKVGECFIRERGCAPYKTYIKLLPDPWIFPGLAQEKAQQCLQTVKKLSCYETPTITLPESETREPSTSSPSTLRVVPNSQGQESTRRKRKRAKGS